MWQRESPQGGSPRVREDPLGTPPSLSAKKVSENLEKVPRIWEGEGYWRSEIMNASNNDYWVALAVTSVALAVAPLRLRRAPAGPHGLAPEDHGHDL